MTCFFRVCSLWSAGHSECHVIVSSAPMLETRSTHESIRPLATLDTGWPLENRESCCMPALPNTEHLMLTTAVGHMPGHPGGHNTQHRPLENIVFFWGPLVRISQPATDEFPMWRNNGGSNIWLCRRHWDLGCWFMCSLISPVLLGFVEPSYSCLYRAILILYGLPWSIMVVSGSPPLLVGDINLVCSLNFVDIHIWCWCETCKDRHTFTHICGLHLVVDTPWLVTGINVDYWLAWFFGWY